MVRPQPLEHVWDDDFMVLVVVLKLVAVEPVCLERSEDLIDCHEACEHPPGGAAAVEDERHGHEQQDLRQVVRARHHIKPTALRLLVLSRRDVTCNMHKYTHILFAQCKGVCAWWCVRVCVLGVGGGGCGGGAEMARAVNESNRVLWLGNRVVLHNLRQRGGGSPQPQSPHGHNATHSRNAPICTMPPKHNAPKSTMPPKAQCPQKSRCPIESPMTLSNRLEALPVWLAHAMLTPCSRHAHAMLTPCSRHASHVAPPSRHVAIHNALTESVLAQLGERAVDVGVYLGGGDQQHYTRQVSQVERRQAEQI
jgi:hypothetical protein